MFLHPAQRGLVERERTGPARVVGSAGTGKTLVALQRAWRLWTRVLLTMFSTPFAAALADKLKLMTAERPDVFERATIASFGAAARDLVTLATGRTPFDHIIVDKAQDLGAPGLRFLAGVVSNRSDALLFAGDIGQRIFQQLFSSNALGVDVRGRSATVREPTDSSMGGTGRSPSSRGRRRRTVLALISA